MGRHRAQTSTGGRTAAIIAAGLVAVAGAGARRWRGMVEQSVKTLKTYDDAVAALEDAPTCSA